MTRLGILGGVFNPPHIGHLVCAQEARWQLGLDRVLLVVAAVPPHKPVHGDTGAEVRAALCDAAAGGEAGLEVSRRELGREGPSYTVDTLQALHDERPEDELIFIAGGDQAAALASWREPHRVLELASFAVADRAGHEREAVEAAVAEHAGADRVTFFSMPRLDISSTEIRARVGAGHPIRHLVPDAVAHEITARGLYGGARPA